MDKSKFNMYGLLALIVIIGTLAVAAFVVISGTGGDSALNLILGFLFGLANGAATFYFGSNKQSADATRAKIASETKPC